MTRYFLCLLAPLLLAAGSANAEWLQETRPLMGTEVSVELWADDPARGRELIDSVFTEFERLDSMMNPWNDQSELARLNREAGRAPQETTEEIIAVIERAAHYSRLSDGAFDISFASAGQHYDYREGKAPTDAQLKEARAAIDYRAIELDKAAGRLYFRHPDLQIDLGGIAKGYAVDRAIARLAAAGVRAAVVAAGGDSRIIGDMGDRPRVIGIRHPRKTGEYAVMIPLADTAISTSGDYERYFERDGERIHHILDPTTGRSAGKMQSASILAPRAVDSDALSTTVFVLGVKRGLALVNQLPDVEAILIDGQGKLHYSEGLLLSTTE